MAYDPKSFLDQALKTGFESVYSQPSGEGDAPQYQGDVATFGNVQVRPLLEAVYEGTGDAAYQGGVTPAGHMVSVPLTGKYEGYFRNDIYDNEGNFLRTTLTEPDNDKYGLKALAQMGLTAASFGGLGPLAQGLASAYKGINAAKSGDILGAAASILPGLGQIPGVSSELADTLKTAGGYAKTGSALQKAVENKDIFGLLEATSGIPGAPKVPTELTDVLKSVGQANKLREAISSGNPEALFREVVGLSKSEVPFSKLADITGADAIEGFFAPGGEGYVDPNAGDLPSWALDPYKTETKPSEYYAGLGNIVDEWDEADIIPDTYDTTPKTSMTPTEMSRFLEANIDDPGTIETLMQDYFPDLYRQTINVTGTKATTPTFTEVPDRTPGSPTDTTPGTVLLDDDRTVATTPGTTGTTKPGATKPGATKPAAEQKGTDWAKLFGLLGAMQRPRERQEQYQLANMPDYEDLMYGLSSGETPYMRG